jgi:hypothetical protein
VFQMEEIANLSLWIHDTIDTYRFHGEKLNPLWSLVFSSFAKDRGNSLSRVFTPSKDKHTSIYIHTHTHTHRNIWCREFDPYLDGFSKVIFKSWVLTDCTHCIVWCSYFARSNYLVRFTYIFRVLSFFDYFTKHCGACARPLESIYKNIS